MITTTWIGGLFVAEWTITTPTGTPVTDATVTGTVTLPDGTSVGLTVAGPTGNVYTATYQPAAPGRHAWQLAATGTAVGAEQGEFIVRRDLVGLPPINTDPTTDIGMIRLLITDLDEADPLLTDAQLQALLDTALRKNVKRAAAAALEVIARSETLVSKVVSTSDGISVNGPAVAADLRASAAVLRAEADAEDGGVAGGVLPVYNFPEPVPYGDWNL